MDGIRNLIVIKNLENIVKDQILDHKKGFGSIIKTNSILGKRALY